MLSLYVPSKVYKKPSEFLEEAVTDITKECLGQSDAPAREGLLLPPYGAG